MIILINQEISQKMSNPFHVVTNIKRQIDDAQHKTHSNLNVKPQLKYYSLFLKEIITIQRFFRKSILKKNRKLQAEIQAQLQIKKHLQKESEGLDLALKHAQMKSIRLNNFDIDGAIESRKQNIQDNFRQVIQNVMNSADNFAQNSAISRMFLSSFKADMKLQQELEAEVKELRFEEECHKKRMEDYKQKLQGLRRKMMQQKKEVKELEKELEMK